ncbi:tRNA (N6-threonylcarbamoyladenosine(37)-N6)-methyltransferase TrmO, partial [Acinetobacter ursingii]|uniref:tRNA (N6-threonylcarbamoyladenosine(37)-N6)-methyltransferase TrmO n=1 Tax=Acinetobacter ursingii TaxID=108980 RepID=UPI00124BE211
MNSVNLPIIGSMHSPYREKFGIPRQPNLVQVESYIEMYEPYNDPLAFEGIEEFSHLWLIWQFHDNKHQQEFEKFRPQVRPPRLGGNKKIGVFATRSMYRPAPIGLSVVQFTSIE